MYGRAIHATPIQVKILTDQTPLTLNGCGVPDRLVGALHRYGVEDEVENGEVLCDSAEADVEGCGVGGDVVVEGCGGYGIFVDVFESVE